MNKEEIRKTIDELLSILDNNFRSKGKVRIPLNDVFDMMKDLFSLIKSYESERRECGKLVILKYIPMLNLLIKVDTDSEHLVKYSEILKYSYKIGARISLEHYMVYREWDEPQKEKFFEPRYNILNGYIHYLQEIDSNPNFKLLIFNAPSGYGKTYPEKISEAWSYGAYDERGTILALCSNDDVVKGGSRTVIDEIKSEAFGEVFPELKWSKEDKDFFLKETDSNWKLRDCKMLASYYASTTNSNVVGERASKRIHIDDLYPNYKEALNQETNRFYINTSMTVWEKRFIQNRPPKVVITGTLWASGDYIDLKIKQEEREHTFKPHPKYKYTRISDDGSVVIIQVPALDYETGESTCPELKSTQELLREKSRMEEYLWETNFQQRPTNPEALIFSYDKLRTYGDKIPLTDDISTYAVIDATRKKGSDFFAMPIFKKIPGQYYDDYYLVDCIFSREATKDMYDEVVKKIRKNHIIKLVVESNVTSELVQALEERCNEQGITYCEFDEKYNTITKSTRIVSEMGIIKKQMLFPPKGRYGENTEMGRFMNNLTTYNSVGTNANDDSPDSLSLFSSEIIEENSAPQIAEAILGIREFM